MKRQDILYQELINLRRAYPEFNIPVYPKTHKVEVLEKLLETWKRKIYTSRSSTYLQSHSNQRSYGNQRLYTASEVSEELESSETSENLTEKSSEAQDKPLKLYGTSEIQRPIAVSTTTKSDKNIKGYLHICILAIQIFCAKFLNIKNISGFFEDHMFFIDKYEKLINRISTKNIRFNNFISILEPTENSNIEVLDNNPEIKLIFYIIFYSLIIIIVRRLMESFGKDMKDRILKMISSGSMSLEGLISSVNTPTQPKETNEVKKPRFEE